MVPAALHLQNGEQSTIFSECQLEQKDIKMDWDWNKVNTFERFRLSLAHL